MDVGKPGSAMCVCSAPTMVHLLVTEFLCLPVPALVPHAPPCPPPPMNLVLFP